MTEDRRRLILSCVHWDQFIFLIADDRAHGVPPDGPLRLLGGDRWPSCRASRTGPQTFRTHDDRVDLIDLHADDQGVVKIHSLYVRYLLPMMCEVQWWEFAQ